MTDGNEGQIVLADAQFGVARLMQPSKDYRSVYDGVPATDPIYLFPDGKPLDDLAGQPGYDPTLARFLAVPFGARIVLWLPNLFYSDFGDPPTLTPYRYRILWRMRNIVDFRRGRKPWHVPRDRGEPDSTAPAGERDRVPIPAGYQTVGYVQPESSVPLDPSQLTIRQQTLSAGTQPVAPPRTATGTLALQQGMLDPTVVSDAKLPGWLVHELQATADEFIVAVERDPGQVADWDFGNTDSRLAAFFDAEGAAVKAFVGTSP